MKNLLAYSVIVLLLLIQVMRFLPADRTASLHTESIQEVAASEQSIGSKVTETKYNKNEMDNLTSVHKTDIDYSTNNFEEYKKNDIMNYKFAYGSVSLGEVSIDRFNILSMEELCTFKGIGKVTASRIQDYIKKNGNLLTYMDLLKIKGIGKKKLSDILGQVVE